MNKLTKEEKLLAAIGDIDDELLVAADESSGNVVLFPRKRRWQSIALSAACFLLCAGVWFSVGGLFGKSTTISAAPKEEAPLTSSSTMQEETDSFFTESAAAEESCEEEQKEMPMLPMEPEETASEQIAQANPTTGGTGGGNSSIDALKKYDNYNTPLLPLTAEGDTDGVLPARELPVSVPTKETVTVSDSYMLSNCTAEDKLLTLQYRYGTNLSCNDEVKMTLNVPAEEQQLEISENISTYRSTGSFAEAYSSWETYSQRLENLDAVSDDETRYMGEETVYVYSISNITLPGGTAKDVKDVVSFEGREDGLLLVNGMDGYYVKENGVNAYSLYTPSYRDIPLQIIAYGEELDVDVIAQREEQELKMKVDYELAVESMTLREALTKQYRQYIAAEGQKLVPAIHEEQIINALLYQLNDLPFYNPDYENQAVVSVEQLIYDTIHSQRLFILEQTVTLPAGESICIHVSMEKWPSHSEELFGIEIVGQSQSSLELTKQKLNLSVDDSLTCIEHNLTEGSGSMELSPSGHYYADFQVKS